MNRQTMGCVVVLWVLFLTAGCGESHAPPGVEVGKVYAFSFAAPGQPYQGSGGSAGEYGQVSAVVGRWIQVQDISRASPRAVWINSDLVFSFEEQKP